MAGAEDSLLPVEADLLFQPARIRSVP